MSDITIINHPLVQHKLSLMRDVNTSTNGFRSLLREIAQLMAYEITRDLPLVTRAIETPVTAMDAPFLDGKKLALISIMRAGNGMLDGVLELIPNAKISVVGLYRDEDTLQPVAYFDKVVKNIDERTALIVDPMLATGGTLIATIDLLKKKGCTKIMGLFLVAAPEGIRAVVDAHPDVDIFTAAIDERLNENGYILPGLGDAGDKIFGTR